MLRSVVQAHPELLPGTVVAGGDQVACEHVFVSAQGSPAARFTRALATRNPTIAWAAACELPRVELAEALDLCLLVVAEPSRYQRAATRWHARYCTELRGVTLVEAQLLAAALPALPPCPASSAAADALARLADQRGLEHVVRVLESWAE